MNSNSLPTVPQYARLPTLPSDTWVFDGTYIRYRPGDRPSSPAYDHCVRHSEGWEVCFNFSQERCTPESLRSEAARALAFANLLEVLRATDPAVNDIAAITGLGIRYDADAHAESIRRRQEFDEETRRSHQEHEEKRAKHNAELQATRQAFALLRDAGHDIYASRRYDGHRSIPDNLCSRCGQSRWSLMSQIDVGIGNRAIAPSCAPEQETG